jgi:hypothetical protein
MKLYIYFVFISIFSLLSAGATAQEAGAKFDFFGYADNREFGADYTVPKTIFGVTLSPQLYLKVDSNHFLYAGAHINQDFGFHPEDKVNLQPITYYNYRSQSIDFAIGFIPRHERLQHVPRIVLADTFLYDRPNLEGMYFEYKNKNIKQSFYIDWLSKQSHFHREQFIAGLSGRYRTRNFYFAHDGILYHNALTSSNDIDEHIQDNAVYTARLGWDISTYTSLDSLTVEAGGTFGFDRHRTIYAMGATTGLLANVYMQYKHFFVDNTLYLGDGHNLPNADPFYHHSRYNRLDLGWMPFRGQHIEGKFTASFHFTKGRIDNQQAFTLRYKFGNRLWKK